MTDNGKEAARIARRYARIERWVLQFDKGLIAKGFASLCLRYMACRRALRESDTAGDAAMDAASHGHGIIMEWAPKLAAEKKRRSNGGDTTAQQRKDAAEAWHTTAIKHARELIAAGRKPHEVTAMVAKRLGLSAQTVRPVLQAAGIVPKKKTKTR